MIPFLHLSILEIIQAAGYFGLIGIVFAESGLFFGFFLPGDSLLFTAGLLASQRLLNIWILLPTLAIAAILGDSVGYWFGKKVGHRIFVKEDSFFFSKQHIDRTRRFYEKYGPKAVVLARFVPVVRTFTPILAGVGEMRYRTFLTYNMIGGVLWAIGVTLLGYFFGSAIPTIDRYILPISLGIIVLSFVPIGIEMYRERNSD